MTTNNQLFEKINPDFIDSNLKDLNLKKKFTV